MNDFQSKKRREFIAQSRKKIKETDELIEKTLKRIGITREQFLLYKLNSKELH